MLFVIQCIDKPDHLAVRLSTRDAHLEYVARFADRLLMAGPFLDEEGQMTGSMLILDFDDRAAVEAFCAEDPYALAGLFERVTVTRWKKALPAE